MKKTLAVLLLMGAIQMARADSCAAGTLASVFAQGTCDVGNLRFTFSNYDSPWYWGAISPGSLAFDPVVGSSSGFKLSGPLISTTGVLRFDFEYTVSAITGYIDDADIQQVSHRSGGTSSVFSYIYGYNLGPPTLPLHYVQDSQYGLLHENLFFWPQSAFAVHSSGSVAPNQAGGGYAEWDSMTTLYHMRETLPEPPSLLVVAFALGATAFKTGRGTRPAPSCRSGEQG